MKKNFTLLVLALFLYIPQGFAGFTLSGSTITQSGTVTDLSGLSGITGVIVTVEGSGTTERRIYNIGNYSLRYNDMKINPERETLVLGTGAPNHAIRPSSASSRLIIGSNVTKNGERIISEHLAIVVHRQPANVSDIYHPANAVIYIDQGTLEWWEGIIRTNMVTYFGWTLGILSLPARDLNAGSFIREGAVFESFGNPPYTNEATQFSPTSKTLLIDGLKLRGISPNTSPIYTPRDVLNTPPRIELIGTNGISDHSALGKTTFTEFRDYNSTGNFKDLNLFDGHLVRAINVQKGSATIIVEHNINNGQADGIVEITKEFTTRVTDLSGNPIVGARYFIRDTNNGDRRNAFGQTYTNDFTYTDLTDANGETAVKRVLTAVVAKADLQRIGIDDTGLNKKDRRSVNNNTDDEFDVHFWSYPHNYSLTTQQFKGIGVLDLNQVMTDDFNITESNKATVDAYASIDNLDQLYDRAKSWKVDLSNLEYPTVGAQLIDGDGTKLDLDNINLMVNVSAASAFAVNTGSDVVTIKAASLVPGNRFKSIKTTGTISLLNGAELKTGYEDSTGTYVYLELTNLDQQTILVTDLQNPGSPPLRDIPSTTGTYTTHFQLPPGGEINVLVERTGYAPWTETIPDGDLNFVREVSTSLSAITAQNQIKTIDLLIKLLQKTEAVLHTTNVQSLPVPSVSVSTTTTAISAGPSVDNQEAELALLRRILAKMTAVREAVNQN